jgi:DNA-binding IclR family transcriptional regulator
LIRTDPDQSRSRLALIRISSCRGTAFLHELAATRERGYSIDDGELEGYVNCIGVPVRDASGSVLASVSIMALKARADLTALRETRPSLLETADPIAKELG